MNVSRLFANSTKKLINYRPILLKMGFRNWPQVRIQPQLFKSIESIFDDDEIYKNFETANVLSKMAKSLTKLPSGIELDVKETETDYNLEADMPGLVKQDIKLKINNNLLLISAERKMDKNYEKEGNTYRERYFGKFSRTLQLPIDADESGIKAKYDNGVLSLTIPKSQEAAKDNVKSIDVN